MFIDTHAHLQWKTFDKDRELVIKRAIKKQVLSIVNIGFDIENSSKALELADKYNELYATVGIHPHNANQLDQKNLRILENLSRNRNTIAVGEIGLDYYRNLSPQKIQKKAFEIQLMLASKQNLPVIIHNREAESDILTILSKFKGKIRGIMHCFSGDISFAKKCIQLGFLISFSGNVTYTKAYNLHKTAKLISLENIVIETDCPWLAPQSVRGKRNEPSYIPLIAQKIAEIKQVTVEEIAIETTKNAKKIFDIK